MLLLKAILIPPLIKTLLATRQPLLCALIYGAALFTNGLMFDVAFGADKAKVLGILTLNTVAAIAYFFGLKETEDMGGVYWGVLVIGAGLMLFALP